MKRWGVAGLALCLYLAFGPMEGAAQVLNMSHDLVRLGIATQNLTPNTPSLDARPLFQAAVTYVQSHSTSTLTLDTGSYYFLTPEFTGTYLDFFGLSHLTVDLAGSTIYFQRAFLQGFIVSDCQNFTLTNFSTDFLNPPYTHVQVSPVTFWWPGKAYPCSRPVPVRRRRRCMLPYRTAATSWMAKRMQCIQWSYRMLHRHRQRWGQ